MYRIFISLTIIFAFAQQTRSQDIITDKQGIETPCQVTGMTKKHFLYKGYEDPEFTSQRVPITRVRTIRYADGRVVKVSPSASGWIYLGLGPCFPLGSYSSNSNTDQYAGFAKKGNYLQAEVAIPVLGKKKQWSIVTMMAISDNQFEDYEKVNWYTNQNQSIVYGRPNSGTDKARKHELNSFMIGLAYSIPLSWKFSIDQKITTGIANAKRPVEHYTFAYQKPGNTSPTYHQFYSYGGVNGSDTVRAATKTGTINYGLAIRFNISPNVGIKLGADFQYASPTFKVYQYATPAPPTGQPFDPAKAESINSRIAIARVNFGVCLNLLPKKINYGLPQ